MSIISLYVSSFSLQSVRPQFFLTMPRGGLVQSGLVGLNNSRLLSTPVGPSCLQLAGLGSLCDKMLANMGDQLSYRPVPGKTHREISRDYGIIIRITTFQ